MVPVEGLCEEKNVNYSLANVENYANEKFFNSFEEAKWAKCIEHVKKIEEEYLEVADDIPVHM